METTSRQCAARLVTDVAGFGNHLSQILHTFDTIEHYTHYNLPDLITSLDATIQGLNQVGKLLCSDELLTPLFSDEGIKYVETLTEECSVVMERVVWVVTGDGCQDVEHHSKFWKTSVSVDEKKQRVFRVPALSEAAMLRGMANSKEATMNREFRSPTERLEKLQLLLLLVVQVVTVRELTTNPSDDVAMNLSTIVEYHARIGSTANKARIASSNGLARNTSRMRRDISPSISSDSDNDSIISIRVSRPKQSNVLESSRGPPPPPPAWLQNTSPPRPFGPPPLPPTAYPRDSVLSPQTGICHTNIQVPRASDISNRNVDSPSTPFPPQSTQIVDNVTKLSKDPPVYSEKEEAAALADAKGASLFPAIETGVKLTDKATKHTQDRNHIDRHGTSNIAGPPAPDSSQLLNSEISGLRTKIKAFFRTKSSLEAEMKRTLASANASLKAFLIQDKDFRMVPHSAFHSLEYTHMRTILSQLKDNAWFKTFSDLTDAEHEALAGLLSKHFQDGKWVERELVVLKVMQQNRFNAWMRIMEECLGLEYSIPQYENYRVTLAIVREKECAPNIKINNPPKPPSVARATECYQPPLVPHIPESFPRMPPDGKLIVDLTNPSLSPNGGNFFTPSGGSLPNPPPSWTSPRPTIYGSNGISLPNVEYYDVSPKHATSESSALEALTSCTAFTIRPAPVQQSPLGPLLNLPPKTWARCSITREREVTMVLLQRIQEFRCRGDSIIDLKMKLTEPQSAQLNHLIQEVNRQEHDFRFDHKIVELSMMDHERGIVRKEMPTFNLDVIHIIIRRAPKESTSALTTYNSLMRYPPRGPPPPPPPPPEPVRIITDSRPVVRTSRNRARSVSTYYTSDSSDSDSSIGSASTNSSFGMVYRNRKGQKMHKGRRIYNSSDESDADEDKPRWKVDPVLVIFGKNEKGSDVVQLLLERWTPSKGEKKKGKEEENVAEEEEKKKKADKDAKDAAKKKRKASRARFIELVDD